ncbi:CheR family methyltransferase [Pseudorhodobacter sp.]|uniref:CheR family methyltransferase n=1 Tax=Pseudorhodobacter sp. TaxID=1934400 RepID=UPI0026475FB5|nr:CheR family methyltransferase [Pseudorhodobacter sp.]MDN5787610.1 PAS domain-containing protein [Pseudorhodobacter sp.]
MNNDLPLVVGIGASAGGVSALSQLFEAVPSNSGIAFVVVTHLNPDRESLLHTVLQRKTDMVVRIAQDGDLVVPDTVYVMPERSVLQIEGGRLRLRETAAGHREYKPIDVFFSALAEDQKENAAAIVLSGGDGDGTLGIKVIKEQGGVTFAQTAEDDPDIVSEMPDSAIATGLVDFAIPAGQMAEKLMQIRDGRATLDALVVAATSDHQTDPRQLQSEISDLLMQRTGHDFSGYKSKTFFRRVARRMQVQKIDDVERYCAHLRQDSDEVDALFRDLLISVTNFFRDTDAFASLEEKVIPKLCENRDGKSPVRIWVPACTTGEEVYSLAILIREYMDEHAVSASVQIFATDIDASALNVARLGRYPEQLLRQASPERLARYFHRDGVSYVVSKKVREMCIFSPHNVISDPPFSRMDMVSCRNLLIYFGPDLQRQIIPTFHYALKPDGYLFLGTSESINQFSDLFHTVDKKHRIFQALEKGNRRWSPSDMHYRLTDKDTIDNRQTTLSGIQLRHKIERHILEQHTPAHAVIRADGEIVFVSGGTGGFLEMPRGIPTHDLLEMVPRDLRLELRATLRQVVEGRRSVYRRDLTITTASGELQRLNLRVEPLRGTGDRERLFIVFFESVATEASQPVDATENSRRSEAAEHELRELRERLQSTVEEYETALEELKSSNEELVSVNEEAQSTNEELEASKEEMQSLNEELNTINAELNGKVEELDRANGDLRNLFDATRIATVFLDGDLVVRTFTPAAADLFSLRIADIGRPLSELASVSDYPELRVHIREVFETGAAYEHRLSRDEGASQYLVRVTPYLRGDQTVEGAVVTLVDITSLAKAEEHQKILIAELNHRVKNMLAVIVTIVKTSLRGKDVRPEVLDTLINRLLGMARAYSLISERSWTSVGMRDIMQGEMAPFGADRIHLSGPNVGLQPPQALAVSMVIHELVTNAIKYGALSNDAGSVEARWSVAEDRLALVWRERDGPQTNKPERNGFGYVLIEGQVEQQLGGKLETSFSAEGLMLSMEFPL